MSRYPKSEPRKRAEPKPRSGTLAMSIPQFCDRHGISEAMYHVLRQRGEGPETMQLGGRVLISVEAAERWREQRTAAASSAA